MGKLRDNRVSVRLNTRPMRNSPSATGATVEMTVVTSVMAAPSIGWIRWFVAPSQMKVHSRRVAEAPWTVAKRQQVGAKLRRQPEKTVGVLDLGAFAPANRPGEAAQAGDDGGSAAVGG